MKTRSDAGKIAERYPLPLLFIFTLICLLPAMIMRDFTPSNELRYMSIADEALANGNWFAFTNHGAAYADKPPLYFWIVMVCRLLLGKHSCLALSLFSLVPAFVIIKEMDSWVMTKASSRDRVATGMMLLTSVMFLGTAIVLRMDMLMCMFIVLALKTFHRMYTSSDGVSRKDSLLLPFWIFMALFTKGPVGLFMPPLSILVFLIVKGKWKDTGKYLGWKTFGIIAALAAVWILLAFLDRGREYIDNLLFKQTVGRAVNAFTHKKPFWFYGGAIVWCIAPYCLLLLGSFVVSLVKMDSFRSDTETLFVCTIASCFVMLSSFSSKLPIYLCPIFPFIVYLCPLVLERTGAGKWTKWALGIPAGILALSGLAIILALSGLVSAPVLDELIAEYPFAASFPVKMAGAILLLGNVLAITLLFKRESWDLSVFLMGASMLLMIYSASSLMNRINPYFGYRAVCEEVPQNTEVMTLFVHRPENMDVYLGRQIVDYGKDVEAFISDMQEDSDKPRTLIITESKIQEYAGLDSLLAGRQKVYSGPFCVVNW